jgi:hypothetical protein
MLVANINNAASIIMISGFIAAILVLLLFDHYIITG